MAASGDRCNWQLTQEWIFPGSFIKWRWLLGDLVSLWKVLINSGPRPRPLPFGKVESIVQFLNFNEKASRYEVNRWGDLKPFWLEVRQYVTELGSSFVKRVTEPRI